MKKIFLDILVQYLKITYFDINKRFTKRKIEKYQKLFNGNLLDIGAGKKPYARFFENVENYIGTNSKSFHGKDAEISLHTDVWVDDGTKLPFENNEFDGVVCFQVLSVIKDTSAFFKEINRVLKTNGVVILTTDFIYPKWYDDDHSRLSENGLKSLATQNNFEVIKVESYGGFYSMYYCVLMHYLRSYPTLLKRYKGVRKTLGLINYILYIPFIPIISLLGMIIYIYEKNIIDEFEYSYNNLIVLKKSI